MSGGCTILNLQDQSSQVGSASVSTSAISIQGLVFAYPGQRPVLQGISVDIFTGERVALLGATGCGKSTLLEHLIGLKQAKAGLIWIQDIRLETATLPQIRRLVGFSFQNADDQLFMPTILEDVTFGPRNYGIEPAIATEKARQLLSNFGLGDYIHRSAHELSGGQKRLAALAAILALEPEILILDEPTTGLDPKWRRYLAQVLLQMPLSVMLIASHDLHWIKKTTNRALVLAEGQIQMDAPTSELFEDGNRLEQYGLPLDY